MSCRSRPGRSGRRTAGFSLVELLVVMAIVGILVALLFGFGAQTINRTKLREAAVQMVTMLEQARSQAQRTPYNSTVTLSGSSGSPSAGYSTTWANSTVSRTLPNGARVAPYDAATSQSMVYNAPYGELSNAAGLVWVVTMPNVSGQWYVKAIGVTGKVILSAAY